METRYGWLTLVALSACTPFVPVPASPPELVEDPGGDADGDGTINADDCGEDDPSRHAEAVEACDLVDQDCDLSYTDLAITVRNEWRVEGDVVIGTDTYDSKGHVVSSDVERDGQTTHSEQTWDGDRVVERVEDGDGLPGWERRSTFTFDASGRQLTREEDEGDDGVPDAGEDCEYAADGTGVCTTWTGSRDSGGWTRFLDANGSVVREEGPGGTEAGFELTTWTYTYTPEGWVESVSEDYRGDGRIELARRFTYERHGLWVTWEEDRDVDGRFESWTRLLRNRVGIEVDRLDSNGGHVVTELDDLGRMTAYRVDAEGDGSFETSYATGYTDTHAETTLETDIVQLVDVTCR